MAEHEDLKNLPTNLAGQDEKRDARALEAVVGGIAGLQQARWHMEEKWTVIDRLWRGDPISRFWPLDTTTMIPEPFKQERAATPRVMLALFPNKDWFRLLPKRKGAIEPKAAKELMQEQFRDGRLEDNYTRFVQMTTKYGTGVAKVPWVTDRLEVTVAEPVDKEVFDDGRFVGSKTTIRRADQTINKDRTELVPLSLFDFWWDWRWNDIQQAPFCADHSTQKKEEISRKLNAATYANITEKEIQELGKKEPPRVNLAGKDLQEFASGANAIRRIGENEIGTVDWWGLFDLAGDGKRVECQIVVLNDNKVVRIVKANLWHGRRPYLKDVWVPVENEGYGIGVIEPIVRMSMDITDLQNGINMAAALNVNPMVKVGDAMNIPDAQLVVNPGRVFRGEQIEQLQPFAIPAPITGSREAKQELRREIDETNGLPRLFLGTSEGPEETATAFAGKRREANLRLRSPIRSQSRNVQGPFLEMCLFNNQQFLDEERTVQYEGRAGQYFKFKVTPQELAGIARVVPILPPQIELLGIRGRLMGQFMQNLAQFGELANTEPFKTMLKKTYENEFGPEDMDDIWPEEDTTVGDRQEEELIVMLKGKFIDVRETDNHELHFAAIADFLETDVFAGLSSEIQAIVNAHAMNHRMWIGRIEEQAPEGPGMEEMATAALEGEGVSVPNPDILEGRQQGQALAEDQRAQIQ